MALTPTLCGVTYDWDYLEQDRYYTPYRVPSEPVDDIFHLQNDPNGLRRNFSASYLDYLRSFYSEHSYSASNGLLQSAHLPTRSQSTFSWYVPVRDHDQPLPGVKYDGHPSCALSLPSLSRTPQQWLDDEDDAHHRLSHTRLKWVDALNAWVSEKQSGKPYLTFVNTPPRVEKYYTAHSSREGLQQKSALQRRTAAEIAEKRKTRKAYSTPVYTSQVQRLRVVRFQPSPSSVTTPPLSPPVEAWEERKEEVVVEVEEEVEEEETKDVEDDVLDCKEEDGNDEAEFSKQMQSIALESVETLVMPEVEENAEQEFQLTPHIKEEHNTKSIDETKSSLKNGLTDAQKTLDAQKNAGASDSNKWKKALNKNSNKKAVSKPKVQKHPAPSPKTVVKASKVLKKTPSISKPKSGKKKVSTSAGSLDKQQSDFNGLLQPLPVSPADEAERVSPVALEPDPPTVPEPTTQVSEEVTVKKASRSPIKKRERVVTYQKPVHAKTPSPEPGLPEPVVKNVSDWIFNSDDDTATTDITRDESSSIPVPQPQLPSVADLPTATPASKFIRAKRRLTALNHKPVDSKKRWGPKKLDTSYLDELRKQELAEERRLRQQQMYDRLHSKKHIKDMNQEDDGVGPNFDDYGFLAKYCIFSRSNLEMYRHAFNAIDDENRGHLTGSDTMLALRVVNNRLTSTEEEYIYRILELIGYKVSDGADFRLFSVLAALSQRISSLDHWMKNLIGQVDFKTLEMKTFMCKTLWECNVDPETNKIPLPQLLIDLRAGGVSFQHQCEIQEKLSHLTALDLLDFLTYVPLFIMIHESVVDNPLDDALDK